MTDITDKDKIKKDIDDKFDKIENKIDKQKIKSITLIKNFLQKEK